MAITLKLYNTLTKQIEDFKPIENNKVSMYHCGPTVYDYPHIGNLRSYVFADTLRRTCEFLGYTVKQVINITDVGHIVSDADTGEDKMEKSAQKSGKSAQEIAQFFTDVFMSNLKELHIETKGTHFPKATDYIQEQIEMIQELEKKGHAYRTSDGVYFDVSTYAEYGKLGNIDLKGLDAGHRVAQGTEKKTPYDFALWKFSPTDGTVRQQEWPSPWGIGFPGWHIECSAMSKKILGETFDIHTGGIDHIPVHHNNEIAQSECASHKRFVNVWMHGAFLNWKDRKMSKSDGTFVTLEGLTEKDISPLAFRYFLLQTKYRQEIFFDMESLEAAKTAYGRLMKKISNTLTSGQKDITIEKSQEVCQSLTDTLTEKISEDLNTPQILAFLWDTLKDEEILQKLRAEDFKLFIEKVEKILGLDLTNAFVAEEEIVLPHYIQELFEARNKARSEKNWTEADRLRDEIKGEGFEVVD